MFLYAFGFRRELHIVAEGGAKNGVVIFENHDGEAFELGVDVVFGVFGELNFFIVTVNRVVTYDIIRILIFGKGVDKKFMNNLVSEDCSYDVFAETSNVVAYGKVFEVKFTIVNDVN